MWTIDVVFGKRGPFSMVKKELFALAGGKSERSLPAIIAGSAEFHIFMTKNRNPFEMILTSPN